MEHYFTNNENAKSNEQTFQTEVLGKKMKFITDIGVFSKNELDEASRFLIETFHAQNLKGSILDVGCGYGAIGIALATGTDEQVHLIDVNLRAIDLAKRNAKLNNVEQVTIYESDCYEAVDRKFDHIISNPPIRAGKKVVHKILEDASKFLEDEGTLTIVIAKQHGAASSERKMMEIFGNVHRLARKKGFWILQSIANPVIINKPTMPSK